MAEDLAIDIGLDIDSDEYASFVDTINNIVDLGCTYSDKVMKKIAEKCKTSELDIVKKVLNIIKGHSRPTPKWWELYGQNDDSKPFKSIKKRAPRNSKSSKRQPPPKRMRLFERRQMCLFEENNDNRKPPNRRPNPPEKRQRKPIKRYRSPSPPRHNKRYRSPSPPRHNKRYRSPSPSQQDKRYRSPSPPRNKRYLPSDAVPYWYTSEKQHKKRRRR
jgi:hypothetical protein